MKKILIWVWFLVASNVALLNTGCTNKPGAEGYRVMSFDSTTGQWVILRSGTVDGKYVTKRMTVVCDFYKWGDRERVSGPKGVALILDIDRSSRADRLTQRAKC
jgi:hypothetical protein